MEAVQPIASPKAAHVIDRVGGLSAFAANADELLHRFGPLVARAQITLAYGFPNQRGHGSFMASRLCVKGSPEVVLKIQLGSPHDVYYTSPRARIRAYVLVRSFTFSITSGRAAFSKRQFFR